MGDAEAFDILVRGTLGPTITDEIEGFAVVASSEGWTRLRGRVPDQARLLGILDLLRGFNVEIESVIHLPTP